MSLLARIRQALLRPKPALALPPAAPYRREPAAELEQLLDELEQRLAAQALRCRTLEAQLESRGERPAPTPTAADLRAVVEVLEALAEPDGSKLARWNTLEFRALAQAMRSLGTYMR